MGEDRDPDAAGGGGGGTDEGYVHRPSGEPPGRGDRDRDREFGWRGWVLVGTLVVSLLVVPATLLVVPHARAALATLGLTRRQAYLVLPLVPALGLGAVAVWSAVRSSGSYGNDRN